MRGLGTALLVAMLLAVAGCGGDGDNGSDGGNRPSVVDLANGLKKASQSSENPYTDVEASCIADIFHASELTDESLQQIQADLLSFAPTGDQETVYRNLVPSLATCLASRLTAPTATPSS